MAHPPILPHATGHLPEAEGHRVYWEVCGNPLGRPALVLHGGPGSGCTPAHRALFDPGVWRVALMDQRGCGRSVPRACDALDALVANTTAHLIGDIERLRAHLGVTRWLVLGGSWGCTLALAYAAAHPDRVEALVLAGVTTTRASELDWLYGHVGALLPEAFAAFRAGAPGADTAPARIAAYGDRLQGPNAQAAADAWCAWEEAVIVADPRATPSVRWRDPAFRLTFARLVTHYFRHGAWDAAEAIRAGFDRIAPLPGTMIHSRLDLCAPLETAWLLKRAWPGAGLRILDGGVHGATDGGMGAAVAHAIEGFAGSPA